MLEAYGPYRLHHGTDFVIDVALAGGRVKDMVKGEILVALGVGRSFFFRFVAHGQFFLGIEHGGAISA